MRDLYADLGAERKVFIDLACSSHNAMWEKNHLLLFSASVEWLTKGSVNGLQAGHAEAGILNECHSQIFDCAALRPSSTAVARSCRADSPAPLAGFSTDSARTERDTGE